MLVSICLKIANLLLITKKSNVIIARCTRTGTVFKILTMEVNIMPNIKSAIKRVKVSEKKTEAKKWPWQKSKEE